MRIAYISATWHADLLSVCREAFLAEIGSQDGTVTTVEQFTVPGALEIPLMAQMLAETGRFGLVVATGFVVDAGVYRHDFVAQAVIQGIVQTSLKTGVPVLSAVLTPHHFHDHPTHHDFFHSHMATKGKELAKAALHTLRNVAEVAKLRG